MQPYMQNDSDKCVALCICGNAQGSTASLVSKDHMSFQTRSQAGLITTLKHAVAKYANQMILFSDWLRLMVL